MFLAEEFFSNKRPRLRGWETERGKALVKFGWPQGMGTTLEGEFLSGRMEVWSYADEVNNFTLFFRDEFLNGNYMVPMDYRYAHAAQTLYLDEPTTDYVSPFGIVPGVIDVLAFRNGESSSEVYAAIQVDVDSMSTFFTATRPSWLYARSALYDASWQPQVFRSDTLDAAGLFDGPPGVRWYYLVQRFDLPFARQRLAFCVEDELALTQSVVQGEASTVRFLGDSLITSDLLLHRGQGDGISSAVIARSGRRFLPNPGGTYLSGEKLRVYFEIYNLGVKNARSDYEVTYSIYEVADAAGRWTRIKRGLKQMMGFRKPPDPIISQTLRGSSTRHSADEDIAIDIAALRDGPYVLEVTVTDTTSGESIADTRKFTKGLSQTAAEE
jgi:hypothetical protein